jgi:hypothetical protein
MAKFNWRNAISGALGSYLGGGNPLVSLGTGIGLGFTKKKPWWQSAMYGLGIGAVGAKYGLNRAVSNLTGTQPTYSPSFLKPVTDKLWGIQTSAKTGMGTAPATFGPRGVQVSPRSTVENPLYHLGPGTYGAFDEFKDFTPRPLPEPPQKSFGLFRDWSGKDILGAGMLGMGLIQAFNPSIPSHVEEDIKALEQSTMPDEYLQGLRAALDIQKEQDMKDIQSRLEGIYSARGWGLGGTPYAQALVDAERELQDRANAQYLTAYDEMLRQRQALQLAAWQARQRAKENAANLWLSMGGQWLGSKFNPLRAILQENEGTNVLAELLG